MEKYPTDLHHDTLFSPSMTQNVDYQVFKQTKEQKSDIIAAKWRHKKFMEKNGISFKKFLNIPSLRIESPIIITT